MTHAPEVRRKVKSDVVRQVVVHGTDAKGAPPTAVQIASGPGVNRAVDEVNASYRDRTPRPKDSSPSSLLHPRSTGWRCMERCDRKTVGLVKIFDRLWYYGAM